MSRGHTRLERLLYSVIMCYLVAFWRPQLEPYQRPTQWGHRRGWWRIRSSRCGSCRCRAGGDTGIWTAGRPPACHRVLPVVRTAAPYQRCCKLAAGVEKKKVSEFAWLIVIAHEVSSCDIGLRITDALIWGYFCNRILLPLQTIHRNSPFVLN